MKRILSIICAALFCAVLVTPAVAKTANPVTQVSTWTGTWNCVSGKTLSTETFAPMLNGKGMRVSVTGQYASEGVATFDSGRGAWFYTFVNADGSYATMIGPVSGSTILFKQVFPPGIARDTITLSSSSLYFSYYGAVVNHKTVTVSEECTKT